MLRIKFEKNAFLHSDVTFTAHNEVTFTTHKDVNLTTHIVM